MTKLPLGGNPVRLLWSQIQQCPDCSGSTLARAQFEHLAEQHQSGNYCRGLEINRRSSVHIAERCGKNVREDGGDYAVEICGAGAQADQREHVGSAIDKRGPEALKERPTAPKHDRSGEHEFDPVKRSGRDVQAERLTEHRKHQQGGGKRGANPEAQPHGVIFWVSFYLSEHIHRLKRHAADRARARSDLDDFRMHWAGVAHLLVSGRRFF